jgi:hypothetical protein
MLTLVGMLGLLFLAGCGGDENGAANRSAVSTAEPRGEPIVIRGKLLVAAEDGSEPIATGTILAGSTLGGTPFCVGGTIHDSHASIDPKMASYFIDRKITCPDGTVRIGLTPEVGAETQSQTQKGSWTIVSGTGAYEGLGGGGKGEAVYSPSPSAPVRETLTGTVMR